MSAATAPEPGFNIDQTPARRRRAPDVPVIASGGLASVDDIRACMETGRIAGAICGRASTTAASAPKKP